MTKFKKLERFQFCPSYYDFKIDVERIDEVNDQRTNREVELIFFNLKSTLIEISIGKWAYDDFIIYVAEICKELENLEINSEQVTDKSVAEVLKKCQHLRFLDISGCPNFVGTAFADA